MLNPASKEIAFAFSRGPHQEIFIQGVLKYATEHERSWSYISAPESPAFSILDLAGWPGDGALAALKTSQEVREAEAAAFPVVNVSSVLPGSKIASVVVDNVEIGRLAAEHLLSKQFRTLAYYGLAGVEFSELRREGFTERVKEAGIPVQEFLMEPTFGSKAKVWAQQHRELAEWLEALPVPVGVFAVTDYRARQVLDACHHLQRRVPEETGVLGVDNEEVVCNHCEPTLSSVARNDLQHGMRAAALLDHLMNGETPPVELLKAIPAVGVIERESTSEVLVSDPRLKEALEYIRQHLSNSITIDHLTRHISVSRRWLEYAFRDAFGESPYQYLRRQRLAKARLMLHDESVSIAQIASVSGFSSSKQFTAAFQAQFGVNPRQYRKSVVSSPED